jgi:spore coat polysaccharide biosynthesis protein SpsF
MSSTRLPGKVLMDLSGQTVLARVVSRLRYASLINELVVATTVLPIDDPIVTESQKLATTIFRGDQDDVLDRYYQAAKFAQADIIVRITSDCPLIDPEITNKTVAAFIRAKSEYTSNVLTRTYPRGLDTEVISFDALGRAWMKASKPYEREHVTAYIYEHPDEFKISAVSEHTSYSEHRWTLDTPEDLAFIRAVYERMKGKAAFSWRDVLCLLEANPELVQINRSVAQRSLHV